MDMKNLERLLFIAGLVLAAYAAFTLVTGITSGVLCYQRTCAHRGNLNENFTGLAFLYAVLFIFGLASAWRSGKNLKKVNET
jgi:hypothetical protein